MTNQQKEAVKQLEMIRQSGETNMFDKNRAIEIANCKGFYALVDEVTEVRKSGTVRVNSKKYMLLLEQIGKDVE